MRAAPEQAAASVPDPDSAAAMTTLRRATLVALLMLSWCGLGALLIFPSERYPGNLLYLTQLFARRQDIPTAVALAVLLAGCGLLRRRAPTQSPMAQLTTARALAIIGVTMLAIWALRMFVLFDHDFTRDEQMASFDAAIYGAGHLFARLPAQMRELYTPLNELFLLPVADHSAWVSNYLPVNAIVRGLAAHVMPPSLVSPLLTGMAGLLLWRIAQRIWPDDRSTQMVILLCFAGSSQVVLTGGATFAMAMHLALNLLWLACFLRGNRAGHAGAMITGFFATGIHQPIFHPLFVLPFLDLLRRRGEWRLLGAYIGAYAVIGLAWLGWPHLVLAAIDPGPGPGAIAAANATGLIDRLLVLLQNPPNLDALWVMAGNLLRFVTWQHVLLVPLLLVGLRKCAGSDDLARALVWGVGLLLLTMTILLPPQGHGWGYRYLHGLIGNCCLLAGYGWRWLAARRSAPVRAMQVTTAISVLVLLPVHALMVRELVAPFGEARAAVVRSGADIVVFETGKIAFDTNFVVNRPDLGRPIVLLGDMLSPAQLAGLCPGRTVAFANSSEFPDVARYYEEQALTAPGGKQRALIRAAEAAGCRIVPYRRRP